MDLRNYTSLLSSLSPEGFEALALEVFRYQALNNPVYNEFISHLKIQPENVTSHAEIPHLPVSAFKYHRVITGSCIRPLVFTSSGTTGTVSSHHVCDPALYEWS